MPTTEPAVMPGRTGSPEPEVGSLPGGAAEAAEAEEAAGAGGLMTAGGVGELIWGNGLNQFPIPPPGCTFAGIAKMFWSRCGAAIPPPARCTLRRIEGNPRSSDFFSLG